MPLHGKRIVRTDEILKRQCAHTVKKLGEATRFELSHTDKYALRKAQAHVGAGDVRLGALKGHATVHRFDSFAAQRVDLLTKLLFKAK